MYAMKWKNRVKYKKNALCGLPQGAFCFDKISFLVCSSCKPFRRVKIPCLNNACK